MFPDSAAASAGIIPNDRILTINGNKVTHFEDIRKEVDLITEGQATIELLRDGKEMTLTFPLKEIEVQEFDGKTSKRPMLGVKSVNAIEVEQEKLSLVGAVKRSFVGNLECDRGNVARRGADDYR